MVTSTNGVAVVVYDERFTHVGATEVIEIHGQERNVGRHVRAAEPRAELDAVEEVQPTSRQAHAV
jgi:hypothetical protein